MLAARPSSASRACSAAAACSAPPSESRSAACSIWLAWPAVVRRDSATWSTGPTCPTCPTLPLPLCLSMAQLLPDHAWNVDQQKQSFRDRRDTLRGVCSLLIEYLGRLLERPRSEVQHLAGAVKQKA